MKIENNGVNIPAHRSGETHRTEESPASAGTPRGIAAGSDRLDLSSEAQFIRSAIDLATAQPEIRQSLVDRMRELDSRGELGKDAQRLADAMIDHWLTTP